MKKALLFLFVVLIISVISGCSSSSSASNKAESNSYSSESSESYEDTSDDSDYDDTDETYEDESYDDESETSDDSETSDVNIGTATGNDWVDLSDDEKYSMIDNAITALKDNGFTVSADADWFIDALDAFYTDDSVMSQKVNEVMAMSGAAGGVLKGN